MAYPDNAEDVSSYSFQIYVFMCFCQVNTPWMESLLKFHHFSELLPISHLDQFSVLDFFQEIDEIGDDWNLWPVL